jgi:hypothetical protein
MKDNDIQAKKRTDAKSKIRTGKETNLKFHGGASKAGVTPIYASPFAGVVHPRIFFRSPPHVTLPLW